MSGSFFSRRGAALSLVVCLCLGWLLAAVMVQFTGARWPYALLFAIPVTLVYAVGTAFSAFYLCRAHPLNQRHPAAIVALMTAAAMFAALLWVALAHFWNFICQLSGVQWGGVRLGQQLSLLIFGFGMVLYALAVAVHYLALEFVRARHAERLGLEAQLLARESELRMLRTQIDPHFLFNSLNSISALTTIDPAGAREMTLQLASFFRQSLGLEAHKKIRVADEFLLIRHFLAIEQVRFGERLIVELALDEAASPCLLPPMLIQPLVENAVKHGVAQLLAGGLVTVTARRAGSVLLISVVNAIDADLGAADTGGAQVNIGLANVRQRLASAYGHQASLHSGRRGDTFNADISMPAETKEAS